MFETHFANEFGELLLPIRTDVSEHVVRHKTANIETLRRVCIYHTRTHKKQQQQNCSALSPLYDTSFTLVCFSDIKSLVFACDLIS